MGGGGGKERTRTMFHGDAPPLYHTMATVNDPGAEALGDQR